jgi:hypothetical protein
MDIMAPVCSASQSDLSTRAGIPEQAVLELLMLSDLACLPGVNGIRAHLYYTPGVDSVEMLASFEPQALPAFTLEFVQQTWREGIPPLPKQICSPIAHARALEL